MRFGDVSDQVEVNVPNWDVLFRSLKDRLSTGKGFALATLNLDHLTKLADDPAFRAAYQAQDMVVADGRPVVWLSRLARKPVELLPGSDLIVPLCALCAELNVPIALVGSSDAALDGAATALQARVPGLQIVYRHAPAFGFDPNGAAADGIFEALRTHGVGLCLIALGAPKQEIFAARGRTSAPNVGFASIGAGLDFLSGHQIRAPRIMRRLALEWLWRAVRNPKRLVPRYARCFAILPGLALQALRQR